MQVRDAGLQFKAGRAVMSATVVVGFGGDERTRKEHGRQNERGAKSRPDAPVVRDRTENLAESGNHGAYYSTFAVAMAVAVMLSAVAGCVCWSDAPSVEDCKPLFGTGRKLGCSNLLLVADHETEEITENGRTVHVVSAKDWLLQRGDAGPIEKMSSLR